MMLGEEWLHKSSRNQNRRIGYALERMRRAGRILMKARELECCPEMTMDRLLCQKQLVSGILFPSVPQLNSRTYMTKSAHNWVLEEVRSCEVIVHNTRRTVMESLISDPSSRLATYPVHVIF